MQNPFWSSEFPCLHFTPPPLVSLCTAIYSCRLLESLLETKAFCLFPIKAFVVYSVPPPHSQISRQEFLLWPPWAQKQSTCSQTEHFLISHFSLSFNLFSNVIYVFVGLKQVRARWGETFHIFFSCEISFRYYLKNEGHFVKVPIPQSLLS